MRGDYPQADIPARKHPLAAHQGSASRSALHRLGAGGVLLDARGGLQFVNDAAEKLLARGLICRMPQCTQSTGCFRPEVDGWRQRPDPCDASMDSKGTDFIGSGQTVRGFKGSNLVYVACKGGAASGNHAELKAGRGSCR